MEINLISKKNKNSDWNCTKRAMFKTLQKLMLVCLLGIGTHAAFAGDKVAIAYFTSNYSNTCLTESQINSGYNLTIALTYINNEDNSGTFSHYFKLPEGLKFDTSNPIYGYYAFTSVTATVISDRIIKVSAPDLPYSYTGGWIKFNIQITDPSDSPYVFTSSCFYNCIDVLNSFSPSFYFYAGQYGYGSNCCNISITVADATVQEDYTGVVTTASAGSEYSNPTYSISGGADAGLFSIGTTGEISFINPPDFDNPADDGGNNVYDIEVSVTAESGDCDDTESITITVTDNTNDNTDAVDDIVSIDCSYTLPLDSNVYANDVYTSGTDVFYLVTGVANGTLSFASDGTYTYNPSSNPVELISDSFIYRLGCAANGYDTATVYITIDPDADGDGICNSVDLDDDNDGILDTKEVISEKTEGAISVVAYKLAGNGNDPSYALGAIDPVGTAAVGDNAGNGNCVLIKRNNTFYITLELPATVNSGDKITVSLAIYQGSPVINFYESTDASTFISTVADYSLTGTADVLYYYTYTVQNGGIKYLKIESDGPANADKAWIDGISVLVPSSIDSDIDGDGIINSLDLDSDNDGCYDAQEGLAVEYLTNLVITVNDSTIADASNVGANGLRDSLESDDSQNATMDYPYDLSEFADSLQQSACFVPNPELSITKTDSVVDGSSEYDEVGDVINYIITVKNAGNVDLTGIVVVDTLVGLSESVDLTAGDSVVYNESITIAQTDIDAGSIVNTATATESTNSLSETASCTVSADQNIDFEVTKTLYKVGATVQKTFSIDDKLSYKFIVKNTGNVTLTSANFKDEQLDGNSSTPNGYDEDSTINLAPGNTYTLIPDRNTYYHVVTIDEWLDKVENTLEVTSEGITRTDVIYNYSDGTETDSNGNTRATRTKLTTVDEVVTGLADEDVLSTDNAALELIMSPNPSEGPVSVLLTSDEDGDADLYVMSSVGQKVKYYSIHTNNALQVDLSSLASGTYLVICNYNGERITKKLILK